MSKHVRTFNPWKVGDMVRINPAIPTQNRDYNSRRGFRFGFDSPMRHLQRFKIQGKVVASGMNYMGDCMRIQVLFRQGQHVYTFLPTELISANTKERR